MKLHQPLQTLVLASLFAGAFTCSADIIYQDTFARAAAGPLAGTAPTLDNTGGSAAWSGSSAWVSDGMVGSVNNTYFNGITLPLNWTNYPDPKVQIDVKLDGTTPATGDGNTFFQLMLGDPSDYWNTLQTAVLELAGNGDIAVRTAGPGWMFTTLTNIAGAVPPQQWNRLRIEYSNTLGTASFYLNGSVILKDAPLTSALTGVSLNTCGWPPTTFTNLLVTFGNETNFPPAITKQPQGETVFVGDPVNINLETSGTLPLQYTWYKNGTPLPGGGPNANVLALASGALSDSGDYKIVVQNAYGSATSSVARVDVHLEVQTPLAQINFDDLNTDLYVTGYPWVSDNPTAPASELPTAWDKTPGAGVGGSTGFRTTCDTTYFQANSVSWAGFSGAIGLALPKLPTANLDFYAFYFSVRVENLGLESDMMTPKTNTPGRLDLRFYIPDPANAGKYLTVTTVEQKYATWTSNFQNFAFVLNRASCSAADQAAFAANLANIPRVQLEFSSDRIYTDFVQGPGAAIVVDNIKLALRQSPAITATPGGTTAILHWDDPNVQLLGAADVAGPYTVIPGATSPYTVPASSPYYFFRTGFTPVPGP